ncbi:MAG: ParB/RepB/Spo0J family partition protein [Pirellulaceae bacterium]
MISTINKWDNSDRTVWFISDLTSHPQQGELLFDVSETERDQLRESIAREGQRIPIEITPEGVIIDGHQRVDALEVVGETAVWVVVRDDLPTPEAVETRFLEANLLRRQLDPLGKVRVAMRFYELADVGPSKTRGEVEKEVAARLNMDTRTLRRYLRIAKTPLAVQEAFSRGELTVVQAERVSSLPVDTQQHVAAQIAKGETPKRVVKAWCTPPVKSVDTVNRILSCASDLQEAIEALPAERDLTDIQLKEIKVTRRALHQLIVQCES